jgi:ABC-2 type transport system ATP-binding protein
VRSGQDVIKELQHLFPEDRKSISLYPKNIRKMSMTEIPSISINEVKKTFKDVQAVKGISFSVRKGEYVALLGPNGAGKTTLMEMIEGIQSPDGGEIVINGKTWKSNERELHRMLGISLQETNFFDKLKVKETLDLFSSFYALDRERSGEILKLVDLEEKKNAYVKNLSGGQRQRLSLGIALINHPEILLLDEPTTGLDPTARREVWEILFRLKKERQITMMLTTHYMEEADFLCERIIIMDKGNILAQGTVDELISKSNGGQIIEFSVEGSAADLMDETYKMEKNEKEDKWKVTVKDIAADLPAFLDKMNQKGIKIKSLECRKMTLDDIFISMTGRKLTE